MTRDPLPALLLAAGLLLPVAWYVVVPWLRGRRDPRWCPDWCPCRSYEETL